MEKIKLPRKRKKRFIKELGKLNYMAYQVIGEILLEDGRKDFNRFYKYGDYVKGKPKIIKRY